MLKKIARYILRKELRELQRRAWLAPFFYSWRHAAMLQKAYIAEHVGPISFEEWLDGLPFEQAEAIKRKAWDGSVADVSQICDP